MAVFEYDTLNLPGTAALDPEKTLKDIGVTLTSEDIVEAGGVIQESEDNEDAGEDNQGGVINPSKSQVDDDLDGDTLDDDI